MKKETFIETDMQYHSGHCLDQYNDEISICAAQQGKDGKVYLKWIYPQTKDKKPSEKTLPWKVNFGSVSQAIEALESYLNVLKTMRDGQGEEKAQSGSNLVEYPDKMDVNTSDIPF